MKTNNEKLKIFYKKVAETPEVMMIEDTLEEKQKLVGGLIEVVSYDEDIVLVCNEEGKILNMQPNLLFDYDYIAGNCFFVGDDFENSGFKSLTDEQIEKLKEIIKERDFISILNQEKNIEEKEI